MSDALPDPDPAEPVYVRLTLRVLPLADAQGHPIPGGRRVARLLSTMLRAYGLRNLRQEFFVEDPREDGK